MRAFRLKSGALVVPSPLLDSHLAGVALEVIHPNEHGYREWLPFAVKAPPDIEAWAESQGVGG